MSYNTRLTQASQQVLDLALREALAHGHNFIAPEHIEAALRRHKTPLEEIEARLDALEKRAS